MWIVLSFVSCFLSAVAAVYRKSGIKGQNPFWYGAISLTISTITIFIIGIITGDNGNLLSMPQYIFNLTIISGIIQGLSWLTYMFAIYYIDVSKVAALDKCNIVATMIFREIRNMGQKSADEVMVKLFLYTYDNMAQEKKKGYLNRVREMNA